MIQSFRFKVHSIVQTQKTEPYSIVSERKQLKMREDIESNYRIEIEKVLEEVKLKRSDIKKERILADPRYVEALLDYITADLIKSRVLIRVNRRHKNFKYGYIVDFADIKVCHSR